MTVSKRYTELSQNLSESVSLHDTNNRLFYRKIFGSQSEEHCHSDWDGIGCTIFLSPCSSWGNCLLIISGVTRAESLGEKQSVVAARRGLVQNRGCTKGGGIAPVSES